MRRIIYLLVALLAMAAPASAQVTLIADRVFLGAPLMTSGSGTPEGSVTATPGSIYLRTDDGTVWRKATGTGNTGWVGFALSGTGTTNKLTKWTGTSTLGDSVASEDSGNLVIAANLLPDVTDTRDIGRWDRLWNQGYLAQLNAVLFALETQTLFSGWSTVGPNAGSFAAAVANSDTSIDFGKTMTPGHFVVTRAQDTAGAYTSEFIQVGTLVSGTRYNVTRNLSGLGAKNWAAGVPWLLLGTDGTGRIDLLAYDGKPRIVFTQQGSAYNTQTVHAVLGNLNGYYGYGVDRYGAGIGVPGGASVLIDNFFGIRMFDGTGDERVTIAPAGDAIFDGKVTVGTGRNLVRNSECRVSVDDWAIVSNTGLSTTLSFNLTGFRLGDESSTCYANIPSGTAANGTVTQIANSRYHPVTAGLKYEISAYVAVNRASYANTLVKWYNAAGAFLSQNVSATQCTAGGGLTLADYCRSGLIVAAPTNAVKAQVATQMLHNGTGTDPYLFMVRAYFGEASVEQTRYTEWGPAGLTTINGGLIETDTVTARIIAADTITAAEIAADAITATELAADSVTSAKIAANTIVAGDIAAGTITTTEIAANTIVAGDIAANTITGDRLVAGTITATEITGTTLSVIASDMGTLTAGSITGGTIDGAVIYGGTGNEVTIDNDGIEITAGNDENLNILEWSNGAYVAGRTSPSSLHLRSPNPGTYSQINLYPTYSIWWGHSSGAGLEIDQTSVFPTSDGGLDLGGASSRFGNLYTSGSVRFGGLTSAGNSFVCIDSNEDLYVSATTCDGSAPSPLAEIAQLREELAQLRRQVAELIAVTRQER